MTFPKADRDLLMLLASFSRSPVAPMEGGKEAEMEGGREGGLVKGYEAKFCHPAVEVSSHY